MNAVVRAGMDNNSSHRPSAKSVLLDIAEQIFAEHGYEGTSIRQIALTAGMNLSLISYYFGSKEALYLEIFNHRLVEMHNSLLQITSGSAPEKLEEFLKIYLDGFKVNCNFQRLLYREATFPSNSTMRHIIMMSLTQNFEILRSIIEEGMRDGYFIRKDPSIFYLTLFSLAPMAVCGPQVPSLTLCSDSSCNGPLSFGRLKLHLYLILQSGATDKL